MSEVLCDTNIVSALAKADALNFLELVFPKKELLITEYIEDELKVAKEEGFDFPERIFGLCETITLNKDELKKYESVEFLKISKTDLKNLIIAENRDSILLTNDSKLYRIARRRGIKVHDLRQILKAINKGNLVSENELRKETILTSGIKKSSLSN